MQTVEVRSLKDGQWEVLGTGNVSTVDLEFELVVSGEEDDASPLIEHRITTDFSYSKSEDTIIEWHPNNPEHSAPTSLKFLEPDTCSLVWNHITTTRVIRQLKAIGGMKKIKLGTEGLEVSEQGLSCDLLHASYSGHQDANPLIHHAIDSGVTFIDTSDSFHTAINQVLVSKALKGVIREKVELATNFKRLNERLEMTSLAIEISGHPARVRFYIEASLKRLNVSFIDLYYHHGADPRVPIEITMGELKKLVEERKIKYVGLSEVSASTIERAHAIHHVTAVKLEWTLFHREVEREIIPTCRKLGIGIVAQVPRDLSCTCGPKLDPNSDSVEEFLRVAERFKPDKAKHFSNVLKKLRAISKKKGCTPEQLNLAWVHQQGNDVCVIPVARKIERINENLEALFVKLTPEDITALHNIPKPAYVTEQSYRSKLITFKDTPPLSSWKGDRERESSYGPTGEMKKILLGNQGLEVSVQGLDCGITCYSGPEETIIPLIHHAIGSGVTFIDTSHRSEAAEQNDVIVSKALKDGVREKVKIATDSKNMKSRADPSHVRADIEDVLRRLQVTCIDLYFHRGTDTSIPIEETMGALKNLVGERKINYIGLSQVSASTIERAHAIHPITAVQLEWSLFYRDLEATIIPICRKLGIGIVAKVPLGTSWGPKLWDFPDSDECSKRAKRFPYDKQKHWDTVMEKLREISENKRCTPEQLYLAWVHEQGNDVCVIPVATEIGHIDENIGALSVTLTPEEKTALNDIPKPPYVTEESYRPWLITVKDTPTESSWYAEKTKRAAGVHYILRP